MTLSCGYPRSSSAHTCNICHLSYLTRTSLKEHTKNHTQEEIKCGLCGHLHKNEHILRAHMDIHQEASSLEQHTKCEHETNNPVEMVSVFYTCQMCGKIFKNFQNLRMHERQIHLGVPKQHICECCGAMFYSGSKLRLHMLRHTGERPFTCEICGLRFGTKHRLGNHLVCHSEARPHACGVCGKTFKRQRSLGMHEQNSHGVFSQGASKDKVVISFSCQMCKKPFITKQKLAVHMREHTGERPFRCNICGKVLSSKMGKKNHIRIHTGERPYKCNLCELALKTHAQLYSHL
uniref:C2H2-type domain-containing protein n=1 Tax=Timema genevievae TaxID=629358 RepID=A0A7R9JZ91_TIMGE|nr:unnamed protein product [Timema genevievae]